MGETPMLLKRLTASLRTCPTTIPPGVILCNRRLSTIDGLDGAGTMKIVIEE
jgi:hypothetical protein